MNIEKSKKNTSTAVITAVISSKEAAPKSKGLSKEQLAYLAAEAKKGSASVTFQHLGQTQKYFIIDPKQAGDDRVLESWRSLGKELQNMACAAKADSLHIISDINCPEATLAFVEGASLGNYQFLKYYKDKKDRKNSLEKIFVQDANLKDEALLELHNTVEATMLCRDLINEPLSYLTAVQFSKEMQKAGKLAGFSTKVYNKKQIEDMGMGGLLGVNKGSIDPPTFTVMEYKPKGAKNKKPVVLVGKGVVFDTGGLSLKPTPNSMDEMKCDMAGAAAVVGAMFAVASNKLPVHVVGLVPATDNRPGQNAIVPQDILHMMDGTTVEVLNTDAEGRLILADALCYAKKYNPELVIDLATLTGAAIRAIGTYASCTMGTADQKVMDSLTSSSFKVWERVVQFPLWQEYADELKSDVADLKNLGGGNGGHISAGKFLQHFTNYPWIHIDIAGPAYSNSASAYRTKGGTGVGVRMLYNFIKTNYAK
ncbi:MAG: M17 family metallopeptidase [Flavobacteriales bacterium]